MGDDIEHLKVNKITPQASSDQVFLPQVGAAVSDAASPTEAYGGTGRAPEEPIDPEAVREAIIEALKSVYDPEIPVNIYELGLIYEVQVSEQGRAEIRMTLTAPACPVAGLLVEVVAEKSGQVEGVSTSHVELVWDPPWSPDRMSEAAKLELGML